jgi:acyl-coenzyme A thioesterase PaaI-like protein
VAERANPDHLLVRRFVAAPAQDVPVDTNPLAADLGMRLYAWDASACVLRIRFRPSARHLQGNGVVQGGVVAAMLDFGLAFGALALLEPPASAATVALHVQFERAVQPREIEVRTVVDRLGGRLAFAGATLSLAASAEVLARANATLAVARGPVSPVAE